MKITITDKSIRLVTPFGKFKAGSTVEVPDNIAKVWIEDGYAVDANDIKKPKAKKKAPTTDVSESDKD